jgi:hypothetical protein
MVIGASKFSEELPIATLVFPMDFLTSSKGGWGMNATSMIIELL